MSDTVARWRGRLGATGLAVRAVLAEPPLRRAETAYLLAVTGDDPPPWTWIEGSPQGLLDLLGESPFFEYFLTDPAVSWVIFDTRHNQFVVAGS